MSSLKKLFQILLIVLSVLGIMDASYLTYEKLSGAIPECGTGFDCGEVLSSPYSQIGPIPLSAFGLVFYLTVLILASVYFLDEKRSIKFSVPFSNLKLKPLEALALAGSAGFAFSIYLVGLMAFVIEAWCLYCLVSAGLSTSIFVVSIVLTKIERHD